MDEIRERFDSLDTVDVAERRLEMYSILQSLIETRLDTEFEKPVEGLKELKSEDGYMYKLSQDFLLSSSTMEKENKLEKIISHVKRKE